MDDPSNGSPGNQGSRRLRLACDACHSAKIRCSGGCPCKKCENLSLDCRYSYTAKLGKPKGARNKKTLARLNGLASTPVNGNSSPKSDCDAQQQRPSTPGGLPLFENITPMSIDAQQLAQPLVNAQGDYFTSWPEFDVSADTLPPPESLFNSKLGSPAMDDDVVAALGFPSASIDFKAMDSSIRNKPPPPGTATTCECLRQLTEHLCLLNSTERKHCILSIDIILCQAHTIAPCCEAALACSLCRLDPTVLQLVMTMMQILINWTRMDYSKGNRASCQTPLVRFGNWAVSAEESHSVKLLLTTRVLDASGAILDILRLRLDELTLVGKKQPRYKFLDSENMQDMLERVSRSLADLGKLVKGCGETDMGAGQGSSSGDSD